MSYFWLSFYCTSEDYRPLKFPPNKAIMGWWSSGLRCSDGASTLCIMVKADSEEKAKKAIIKDWPEAKRAEWRDVGKGNPMKSLPSLLDWNSSGRFPIDVGSWQAKRWLEETTRVATGGGT